jgi:hypothetical protein
VKIDVTRDRVVLAGESIVNQTLQPCPVKRKFADFKRLALGALRIAHRALLRVLLGSWKSCVAA